MKKNKSSCRSYYDNVPKIPSVYRKEIEHFVFEILPSAQSVAELNKFEKLTGYDSHFKAHFGDYRVGAFCDGNIIELRRVLHRKEIYRYYP